MIPESLLEIQVLTHFISDHYKSVLDLSDITLSFYTRYYNFLYLERNYDSPWKYYHHSMAYIGIELDNKGMLSF